MKLNRGSRWNRQVAINIHLDHSSPLRKQWSALPAEPPCSEESFVELGPWWATCPGEGVGLLWQPDIAISSIGECYWSVFPWSNQWWLVPCSLSWALLVWVVSRMSDVSNNVGKYGWRWSTLNTSADQGTVGCDIEVIVTEDLGDGVYPISEKAKLAVGSNKALLLQM